MPKHDNLAALVIPVHNRKQFTMACLDRLGWVAAESGWKIIIVDDGSTDGTGTAVREFHPHVEVVDGDGDLYWTGAMVKGMQRAVHMGARQIVWLNDDTHPNEASLRRIVSLVRENPKHIIASCAWADGQPLATGSRKRQPVLPAPGELAAADVLAGFQVAFSTQVMEAIGFPDPTRWPHYAGDSGFTRRAHNAGFQLFLDGGSRIDLCDHPDTIDVGEIFWGGKEDLAAKTRRTFFNKNARYRLASRWHLDCLFRGVLVSIMVFPARCALWLVKILLHRNKARATGIATVGVGAPEIHSTRI